MTDIVTRLRPPRHTARGIVVRDNQIILIERWRLEDHYFSIPGGGIERGETPEVAAIREIMEETTVQAMIGPEVIQMHDGKIIHHLFLCTYVSGEPELPDDAEEARVHAYKNKFKPAWFFINELEVMPFRYWLPIKQVLIDGLTNGFADDITIVQSVPKG